MSVRIRPLIELEPQWLYSPADPDLNTFFHEDGPGRTRFGLWFICPVCPSGHRLWVAWVPNRVFPNRWKAQGTESFETLTITPSIDATKSEPKCFHGWITGGKVTW